ncbi:SAM-dependent methyltransferase [Embleya sp. AB8]
MDKIRPAYEELGAEGFYLRHGSAYRNPHEPRVRAVLAEVLAEPVAAEPELLADVLDLACGSGEATLALRELGARAVTGIDPFTGAAYRERTGQDAEALRFEQIAAGALAGRSHSLVVCSYALHLLAESRLPALAYALSEVTSAFLVVTPHKRPVLRPEWGWHLGREVLVDRARARLYRTTPGTAEATARS